MVRSRNRNRDEQTGARATREDNTSNRQPAEPSQSTRGPRRDPDLDTDRRPTSSAPETDGASEGRRAARQEPATGSSASGSGGTTRSTAAGADSNGQVPARMEQRSLAEPGERNAFEAYGQAMSTNTIVGTLIKFNKGDWITGDDEDLEDDEMELVANMDQLMVGWIKWQDQRPVEQIMGRVADGYQAPRRNTLGDENQDMWEEDDQGRKRDPWQFSNYIVLKMPGEEATEDNLYTFATSSKGGLGAIGALCRDYGREMRRRPDEYPIIKLGSDSYRHQTYGRTFVPMIQIVGWESKGLFEQLSTDNPPEEREEQRQETRSPAREEPREEAREPRRAAGRRR